MSNHTENSINFSDYKILVVDDYKVSLKFTKKILEKKGFKVDATNSGKKALEMYRNNDYDIIFLDIQMPEISGYEITDEIRKLEDGLEKHTLIIALTANAFVGDEEKCLNCGMDGYIPKAMRPYDMENSIIQLLNDINL